MGKGKNRITLIIKEVNTIYNKYPDRNNRHELIRIIESDFLKLIEFIVMCLDLIIDITRNAYFII